MYEWDLGYLTVDGLTRLAELISLYAGRGDFLQLQGDLGAGKSTFARAMIRSLANNPDEEVPSPTFALVQSYETPRTPVHHFDLYRLSGPQEAREIGFEEARDTGLVLAEWADRAQRLLPPTRLRIVLADAPSPEQRHVQVLGEGDFAERLRHIEGVERFIATSGWGSARIAHVAGDASRRCYARLTQAGRTCLLMDSPPLPDGPPVKGGKPYWALAHLAPNVRPFVAVEAALRGYGLSVPAILAQNLEAGLLLVEDFGDRAFAGAIAQGVPMRDLYLAATDVLVEMSRRPAPSTLPVFDMEAMLIEARLIVDWYRPHITGAPTPPGLVDEFEALWRSALKGLSGHQTEWILRDYHSPNLLWMPERTGLKRVGIIDFQDSMAGHSAYDVAALLQDARIEVPRSLEQELLAHYLAGRAAQNGAFDQAAFRRAYALLGAQRTTKILGIFVRLAKRDGKPGYLEHLPLLWHYLSRNLADPGLTELRAWYERHLAV